MTDNLKSIFGRQFGLDVAGNPLSDGRHMNKLVYSNPAASTVITNTAVQTLFSTQATIKLNTVLPGSKIRIKYQGIVVAKNAAETLAITLFYGGLTGTSLFTHAATNVAVNDVFFADFELIFRTIGTAGTMIGAGFGKSIPAAAGTMTAKDGILASTAINTTVDQIIGVAATWSAAAAGNQVRLDFMAVEQW